MKDDDNKRRQHNSSKTASKPNVSNEKAATIPTPPIDESTLHC
jgi:hypothetical protein